MTNKLEELHKQYLEHNGARKDPTYSLSPKSAQTLIDLGKQLDPVFIADLGAGFSSVVLREYFPDAFVLTVDTDPEWLEIVAQDCLNAGTNDYGFTTLEKFLKTPSRFDMLFVDMERQSRIDYFPEYIHKARKTGYVVFDDWQDEEYRKSIIPQLEKYKYNYVKHPRIDEYNRQMAYAWR